MTTLTIGELAKRTGIRTSALRYYERQGLLEPVGRTGGGYRVYDEATTETVRFIQRAQRIGFSLEDIGVLLRGLHVGDVSDARVLETAEQRFVDVERRLTDLLMTRHELERFLLDLSGRLDDGTSEARARYERLIMHVCGHDDLAPDEVAGLTLDWLLERTGCRLAGIERDTLVDALHGVHVHVWQRDGDYCVLVATDSPQVERALAELARIEAECHAHQTPTLSKENDGWLFVARGENAFLFAQFFLALERVTPAS